MSAGSGSKVRYMWPNHKVTRDKLNAQAKQRDL